MRAGIKEEFIRRYVELAKPASNLPEKTKQALTEDAKEKAEAMLRVIEKLGFKIKEKS